MKVHIFMIDTCNYIRLLLCGLLVLIPQLVKLKHGCVCYIIKTFDFCFRLLTIHHSENIDKKMITCVRRHDTGQMRTQRTRNISKSNLMLLSLIQRYTISDHLQNVPTMHMCICPLCLCNRQQNNINITKQLRSKSYPRPDPKGHRFADEFWNSRK